MLTNEDLNYSAVIVEVDKLLDLDGLDNLKGFPVLGCQALVSKDTQVGDIGVVFVAETQLSGDFCKKNNLYRKSEWNDDITKTGYLEDGKNRIKALKLRNNMSTALFMPITSLDYLGYNFKIGDTFTHVNGHFVCKKYVIKVPEKRDPTTKVRKQRKSRIEPHLFPTHTDTESYFRNNHLFNDGDYVTVTQKLHGSSGRFCHQQVRNLSYLEKLSNRLSDKWQERCLKLDSFLKRISKRKDVYTWKLLAGSRTVVKDSIANQGYYKHDIWNDTLDKIGHLIPKNWIIYGELIGYAGQSAIQKNYTYSIEPGKCEFYVYRISIVNEDGIQVDLSWDTIKSFCKKMNLKHVPELWSGYHRDFKVDDWMDKRYADMGFDCPTLDKKLNDEGVIIRREGILPLLLKAKCESFLLHESKQLDTGEVDIESLES